MGILFLIPALLISIAWYRPGVKLQGDSAVLEKKDYNWPIWVAGVASTCLLIVITEITWDALAKYIGLKGLPLELISAFLRAALLEELFKFNGFKMCLDRFRDKPLRKIDYVMLAGLMGLVYGVFEKLFQGGAASLVSSFMPMHMMWQFNQGGHYYEYKTAKEAGDQKTAKKNLRKVIWIPFLFHGAWDAALAMSIYMADDARPTLVQVGAFVLLALIVAVGITYCVKTFKKVKALALSENPEGEE